MSELGRALAEIVGEGGVLEGPAAERGYDSDAYSVDRSPPIAVALPRSTGETARVVRLCLDRGLPFTPRGAGTGLSGGTLPALGGVVISTKRLTRILRVEPENRCLLAESGVANRRLQSAAAPFGLHFAPDPSSAAVATLGGNIAENAGGPHTLKSGVTGAHILGLTLVDPCGEVRTFGGRTGIGPGPDPLAVIVGSEGTLGVVTEAWCRLTPLPRFVRTALASFARIADATNAVAEIVASGIVPAALEMMDEGILGALQAAFGLSYPVGTRALLLVECDGTNEDRVEIEASEADRILLGHRATGIERATTPEARAKLWNARKKGVGAMGRIAPSVVTHDGVIPRSRLPEMLERVAEIARRHDVRVANIFHAGDGNLHPCFSFDDRDPAQVRAVVAAGEEVIEACLALGGSITGEHGVGVEKLDGFARMYGPDDLAVQRRIRGVFGGAETCNPCKVLPSARSCVENRPRWRGSAW